jgi:hypothetical protein
MKRREFITLFARPQPPLARLANRYSWFSRAIGAGRKVAGSTCLHQSGLCSARR